MAKKKVASKGKKPEEKKPVGRPPRQSGVPGNMSVYLLDSEIKPLLEKNAAQANRKLSAWVVERCVHGGPPLPQRDIELIREMVRASGSGPVI